MWGKIKSKLTNGCLRYGRNMSGVTAIEFAILAPLFIGMLAVITETGVMMFTEYTLQASVQEASRLVRTGQAQAGGFSAAQFKAKICNTASLIIDCTGGVNVYVASDSNFANLKGKLPSFMNVGPKDDGSANPTSFACGGPLQTTAVVATFDWKFAMPGFMGFNANTGDTTKRRLVAFSMFQNEPFPTGTSCS